MAGTRKTGTAELRAAWPASRWLLIWVGVFSVFSNILVLTGPIYMLQVYDLVLTTRSVDTLAALSVLVALLFLFMGLIDYSRTRVLARIGARFQSALEERVFMAVLHRNRHPDDRAQATEALRDLDAVQRLFSSPVLIALFDVPFVPVFAAAIFLFHPMLGWLAVGGGATLIILAMINQLATKRRVRAARQTAQSAMHLADVSAVESEIVLPLGMRENLADRYLTGSRSALQQTLSAGDYNAAFTTATRTFRLFLQSAVLGAGAYFVLQEQMTAGAMIASAILLGRALAPIERAMGHWQVLQLARAGWLSLAEFLQACPPETEPMKLPAPEARLEVSGLTVKAPGAAEPALRNINFAAQPGIALGVIGRSGSGKSTLARALTGYWTPDSGTIRLGGAELSQYSADSLGKYTGYLPQRCTLMPGTIAENIARMDADPDCDAVVEAARKASAHEMILGLPNGYDTQLDGSENGLSGGQAQRIALARALFGNPVIVLLDEPNSMLDADGTRALNKAVRDLKDDGKLVLIMTHRPTAIAECDVLMVLEHGQIKAFGPKDEVMPQTIKNVETVRKSMRDGTA